MSVSFSLQEIFTVNYKNAEFLIDATYLLTQLPKWLSGKESACQYRRCRFDLWVRKMPWRNKWQPTPVFLPEKSLGERSLLGYSPWGHKESDKTEHARSTQSFTKQYLSIPFIMCSIVYSNLKKCWSGPTKFVY